MCARTTPAREDDAGGVLGEAARLRGVAEPAHRHAHHHHYHHPVTSTSSPAATITTPPSGLSVLEFGTAARVVHRGEEVGGRLMPTTPPTSSSAVVVRSVPAVATNQQVLENGTGGRSPS